MSWTRYAAPQRFYPLAGALMPVVRRGWRCC